MHDILIDSNEKDNTIPRYYAVNKETVCFYGGYIIQFPSTYQAIFLARSKSINRV